MKKLRKGPMSTNGFRNMIKKCEETGYMGVSPGKGQRPIAEEVVQNTTFRVIDTATRAEFYGKIIEKESLVYFCFLENDGIITMIKHFPLMGPDFNKRTVKFPQAYSFFHHKTNKGRL